MFISIHTPLAGSDMPPVTAGLNRLFQSTLPLRGATSTRYPRHPRNRFQSTLPLRGATRGRTGARLHRSISIHTPLAGSDPILSDRNDMYLIFQSTLPLRGATQSEHRGLRIRNFNPHSPCGERPVALLDELIEHLFQSTLPLRGATGRALVASGVERISIHTPLAGSDNLSTVSWKAVPYFNPHSPCGERPADLKILD